MAKCLYCSFNRKGHSKKYELKLLTSHYTIVHGMSRKDIEDITKDIEQSNIKVISK